MLKGRKKDEDEGMGTNVGKAERKEMRYEVRKKSGGTKGMK